MSCFRGTATYIYKTINTSERRGTRVLNGAILLDEGDGIFLITLFWAFRAPIPQKTWRAPIPQKSMSLFGPYFNARDWEVPIWNGNSEFVASPLINSCMSCGIYPELHNVEGYWRVTMLRAPVGANNLRTDVDVAARNFKMRCEDTKEWQPHCVGRENQ